MKSLNGGDMQGSQDRDEAASLTQAAEGKENIWQRVPGSCFK